MPAKKLKKVTVDRKKYDNYGFKILADKSPGLLFEEAVAEAEKNGLILPSSKSLTKALSTYDLIDLFGDYNRQPLTKAVPCWSGTITAYVDPNKTFQEAAEKISELGDGLFITYTNPNGKRWIFPLPQEYEDKKNAILVSEHPDYKIEIRGDDRIVRAAKVDIVEGFPPEPSYWCLGDPKHDLPCGDKVAYQSTDENKSIRNSMREYKGKRVGPLVRGYSSDCDFRVIHLYDLKSHAGGWRFGVLVEATEK